MLTDQEINEAVARKLGFLWEKGDPMAITRDYCHSIQAAWEIVENLKNSKKTFVVHIGGLVNNPCGCGSFEKWIYVCNIFDPGQFILAGAHHADTAPMAICLAFLKLDANHKTDL